jgi:glycine hydroxymethyltransferase
MVVIDLRDGAIDAVEVNRRLFRHGLVASTVSLPARGSALGLRLGSTAMTIRGAGPAEFTRIARSLAVVLAQAPEAGEDLAVVERMRRLAAQFPIPFQ